MVKIIHSPYTEYLKKVSQNLKGLGMPIYFDLPSPEVPEPFVLIGNHDDIDSNPKTGNALVQVQLQIDLYYPLNMDLADFEDSIVRIKQAVQPVKSIQVTTMRDSTIGRTVRRALFEIKTLIQ